MWCIQSEWSKQRTSVHNWHSTDDVQNQNHFSKIKSVHNQHENNINAYVADKVELNSTSLPKWE